MKGMTVNILKPKGYPDCSLNGISNNHDTVLLVGENVPRILEERKEWPTVRIENHYKDYIRAVQTDADDNGNMFAMGGCFIWCCDSRFPAQYPVPLHDRDMRKEQPQHTWK